MTCFNKDHYKVLKKAAKNAGDVFVESEEVEFYSEEINGVSVAFRPAIENTNGRMLNVAVSYCAAEDKFKSKHGKYQALLKLANGECIQLPLARYLRDHGPQETAECLLFMFTV